MVREFHDMNRTRDSMVVELGRAVHMARVYLLGMVARQATPVELQQFLVSRTHLIESLELEQAFH